MKKLFVLLGVSVVAMSARAGAIVEGSSYSMPYPCSLVSHVTYEFAVYKSEGKAWIRTECRHGREDFANVNVAIPGMKLNQEARQIEVEYDGAIFACAKKNGWGRWQETGACKIEAAKVTERIDTDFGPQYKDKIKVTVELLD